MPTCGAVPPARSVFSLVLPSTVPGLDKLVVGPSVYINTLYGLLRMEPLFRRGLYYGRGKRPRELG